MYVLKILYIIGYQKKSCATYWRWWYQLLLTPNRSAKIS